MAGRRSGLSRTAEEATDGAGPPRWGRVLWKLWCEIFAGPGGFGIDGDTVGQIAEEVLDCRRLGVDVAVVVGGGNLWRGMTGAGKGMDRAQADYMGMLGTVMNALALQDILERKGQPTRVQTAIHLAQIAAPSTRRRPGPEERRAGQK